MSITASNIEDLTEFQRLDRDIKSAARTLPRREARYLVDLYYSMQGYRISTTNQVRSMTDEPHATILFFSEQMQALENQVKAVLNSWTSTEHMGKWAKSITGIGPVISAGLLAHIDIHKAPTVSNIWRYAGYDPSMEWHGTKVARELVEAAFQADDDPVKAILWLARATTAHPSKLFGAQAIEFDREEARQAVQINAGDSAVGRFDERPYQIDSAIAHACSGVGGGIVSDNEVAEEVYRTLTDGYRFDRTSLVRFLAKRPWNSDLKTLCWKLGESFVKVRNNKNDIYGHLYHQRKEWEQAKNENGDYADQAAKMLTRKKIGHETKAYAAYIEGHLPDGQIHARAKRWAVKLFLAHWHHEAYVHTFGKEPVAPYAIQFLGHAHQIDFEKLQAEYVGRDS